MFIFSSSSLTCKLLLETEEQSVSLSSVLKNQPAESLCVLLLKTRESSFQFKAVMLSDFTAGSSMKEQETDEICRADCFHSQSHRAKGRNGVF
jgi:hypothetical protein